MDYLSDEWIAALDRAASSNEALRLPASQQPLVVQQVVQREATDDVVFRVEIAHDSCRVRKGAADDPSVTLTTDLDTSVAIARGRLSARAAFLEGRLRLGGDIRQLIEGTAAVELLGEAFAEVRAETDWP